MLFDKQEGSLSLDQLWIDGGEKLTAPLALKGDADGLREVCFCPASGSQDVGEEALAIDSFRVYASALGILEQKAQEAGARLTFADIKGQNASAGAVEKDLDFSRTETANGLKIMGWKSSNTAVVTTAGKVTRPQSNDLRVTLTPVLGMEDAMNEADGDYITTDGAPITVTVKSIGGGEVKPENIFEYELNESFDAADYNAKEPSHGLGQRLGGYEQHRQGGGQGGRHVDYPHQRASMKANTRLKFLSPMDILPAAAVPRFAPSCPGTTCLWISNGSPIPRPGK